MKTLAKGLMSLLCLMAMTACSEDDPAPGPDSMYLYNTEATVDADEGSMPVTIVTNRSWTVTPEANWITASPDRGDDKGEYEVVLKYTANPDATPRTATVLFRGGTYTVTYTLTQKGRS